MRSSVSAHVSAKKVNVPHPCTQIISQIPKDGEGNGVFQTGAKIYLSEKIFRSLVYLKCCSVLFAYSH